MLIESNALGIEFGEYFRGYAHGPLGIGALLVIVMLLIWIGRRK